MARVCAITNKGTQVGGRYSNRVRATQFNPTGKVTRHSNLMKKRFYVPELKKFVTITVSTKGLRTITKKGPFKALKDAGVI